MASNLSVLVRPFGAPDAPDFDICDRRYGLNLDIPRCDVAAGKLHHGSENTIYQINDQEGPQTLPLRIPYGGCQISVEVAGPNLPQTYSLVPDTVHSLASHIINECVGRAGKVGGFATLDIGNLIDWVINPSSDLGRYPPSSTFLTVSVTSSDLKKPSPGNYDPIIADTLSGAARDTAMSLPASGAVRRRLVERAVMFRAKAMRMSTGGSRYSWWGHS